MGGECTMKKNILRSVIVLAIGAGMVFGVIKLNEYEEYREEQAELAKKEATYSEIIALTEQGNYEDALEKVQELNDYNDRYSFGDTDYDISYKNAKVLYLYNMALKERAKGDGTFAYEFLQEIPCDYKDVFVEEIVSLRGELLPEYEAWQKELAEIRAWEEEYDKQQREKYSKFPHPLIGMNREYINYTQLGASFETVYLGPDDRELELGDVKNRTGRVKYKWKERNFYAITELGVVVDINQNGSFGGKVQKYYGQNGEDFHYEAFPSGGDSSDYVTADDFYDDHYDDFLCYDDAETAWYDGE